MIVRGFKSVMWVATVGGAALGCYMVSLQVATERHELAKVEAQIIAAKREIRSLQTELGTRGRLSQLEHWNAEVLALAAPASAQFLQNELTLARFEQREATIEDRTADVRLASAEIPPSAPAAAAKPVAPIVQAVASIPSPGRPMIHRASFTAPQPKPAAPPAKIAAPAKSTPVPIRTAAAPAAKEQKPATAKAKGKVESSRAGRLDSSLASRIGAAARAETKVSGRGEN